MSEKKTALPKQSEGFSDWYNEVCKLAELVDYGPVKGTMIIKPYGFAIWEKIQRIFDEWIKEKGIPNAYFPLFIPEGFLSKEAEHVEGFSPELAVVTYAGGEELAEKVIIRPTSETIIYDSFSKWINSYRDLPYQINQWCNIVRWEKRTKPFLRTSEFLWQEGHCALANAKEADAVTMERLSEYKRFFNDILALAPYVGKKSEKEKFAGALYSVSCEVLLRDGKALQSATSHDLGQNFSKPFNVMYETKGGKREYVWLSSWGMSTRIIGALILGHGDDKGLVLPPAIAPTQVAIIPIYKDSKEKASVFKVIDEVRGSLEKESVDVLVDDRESQTFGWKSTEWEIKGVPIRIEVGPKDVAKNSVTLIKRIDGKKEVIKVKDLNIKKMLNQIQAQMLKDATKYRDENTYRLDNFKDFKDQIEDKKGFYLVPWCAETSCEEEIKEKTKATTRVIAENEKLTSGKCFHCGKKAKTMVYFAKAY